MAFFQKLFGSSHTRNVGKFEPSVMKINALELQIQALTDDQLRRKTEEFRSRIHDFQPRQDSVEQTKISQQEEKRILDIILPEAFAVVREAARRTLGQRHFDVQLIGGMVLD